MASVGHAFVGMAAGRWWAKKPGMARWRAMAALALLSLLPDIDVLAFRFGIPYTAPFGHRGATHSLVAALLVGVGVALVAQMLGRKGWQLGGVAWLTVTSHGLLDTLTDGGQGVALLWPCSNARFFAPWRPLPVAPMGAKFLSVHGLQIALWETLWLLPILLYAIWPRKAPASGMGLDGGSGEVQWHCSMAILTRFACAPARIYAKRLWRVLSRCIAMRRPW